MYPEVGLRGHHDHPAGLRMRVLAYIGRAEHSVETLHTAQCNRMFVTYPVKFTRAFARPTCLSILSRDTALSLPV